jgi:hypothetical protein
VQLDNVAVALRPRSAWESIDLGVGMLQQWWRTLYASFAPVYLAGVALAFAAGWAWDRAWVSLVVLWWLKPLFDRVALHVVSRAVFGEAIGVRRALADARAWLGTRVPWALTLGRIDMARSFHLPVTQLEGQRGRASRERRRLLGRRAHGYAVWLTVACLHFEVVAIWSIDMLGQLLVPAKASEGTTFAEAFFAGAEMDNVFGFADFAIYALAVLAIEPLYVAAGFALYLNRRTLLEGWDLEVALRRMAERRAPPARGAATAAMALVAAALLALAPLPPAQAQSAAKDPRAEIAEVLKDPMFPHQRERMRWQRRAAAEPDKSGSGWDLRWLEAVGYAFAKFSEAALWLAVAVLLALGLWWAARLVPREGSAPRAAWRAPPVLFGMELAPETLPADLPGAVRALAAAGRVREALALLYRGTLSALVHGRGVALLPSDTEGEALARVRAHGEAETTRFFGELIAHWQAAAYARRAPPPAELERLVAAYAERFPGEPRA